MKKLIVIIILLFAGPYIWAQQGGKKPEQIVVYTCVMHPEVQMSKPGNCPECGMKLVKESPKASPPTNHSDHDSTQMPMKDSSKINNMNTMYMGDNSTLTENIKTAK